MTQQTIFSIKPPLVYVLPGNPTPLARPRFGKNRIFDKQKLLKVNHGLLLSHIHGKRPLFEGPLQVDAVFYLPISKHISKIKRQKMLGMPHFSRPDLDNFIKYILDAANKILFHDDALVAVVNAKKIYDHEPRTEFTITEISDGQKTDRK